MKDIMIDRIALYFVPAVLAVAITVFSVVNAFTEIGAGTFSARETVYFALGVLCSCIALGLIAVVGFRRYPTENSTFFINPITGTTVHGHSEGQVRVLTEGDIYKSFSMPK